MSGGHEVSPFLLPEPAWCPMSNVLFIQHGQRDMEAQGIYPGIPHFKDVSFFDVHAVRFLRDGPSRHKLTLDDGFSQK